MLMATPGIESAIGSDPDGLPSRITGRFMPLKARCIPETLMSTLACTQFVVIEFEARDALQ